MKTSYFLLLCLTFSDAKQMARLKQPTFHGLYTGHWSQWSQWRTQLNCPPPVSPCILCVQYPLVHFGWACRYISLFSCLCLHLLFLGTCWVLLSTYADSVPPPLGWAVTGGVWGGGGWMETAAKLFVGSFPVCDFFCTTSRPEDIIIYPMWSLFRTSEN